MAIKAKITKDEFSKLPEALQESYKADGDNYVLDLDGIDDHPSVAGLKKKNAELLGETKAEREKREALEKSQAEAEKAAAVEKGEFKKLYEKALSDLEAEKKTNSDFRSNIEQRDIKAGATKIAGALTKDTGRLGVLTDLASKHTKFDNGEIVYEIGGVRVDSDKLTAHLKTEYPFLADGSQASGGGAAGDGGGAPSGKQVTRSQFDQMSQSDRSTFAKAGGKVVDD